MFPVLRGVIARRILLNYRADPEVVARALPPCFRPQLQAGHAIIGVCLIRLQEVRPRGWPSWLGLTSENAAHRAAVEWDSPEGPRQGVYIWRRDTSSRLNAWAGGRLFPAVSRPARFRTRETPAMCEIRVEQPNGEDLLALRAHRAATLPSPSVFSSLEEASDFFRRGACGYSCPSRGADYQGVELRCREWNAEPLEIDSFESRFFDNSAVFPRGSIELDCALVMRGIEHEWRALGDQPLASHHHASSR